MKRTYLRAKLHRLTVTKCDLAYEGSITLSTELMRAADIRPYEKVQVANVTNGKRFETYVIEGQNNQGAVELNGAAAHLCAVGDTILVMAYVSATDEKAALLQPIIVSIGEGNQIIAAKQGQIKLAAWQNN